MEAKEIVEILREELNSLEKNKQKNVRILDLKKYLTQLEKESSISNEYRNRENSRLLANMNTNTLWGIELFNAVIESGKSALHSIIIINGGAVIAVMSIIATLVGKEDGKALATALSLPILIFGFGVFSGGIGFAFRYLSQAFYKEHADTSKKIFINLARCMLAITIISGITGLALFGRAIYISYIAFLANL